MGAASLTHLSKLGKSAARVSAGGDEHFGVCLPSECVLIVYMRPWYLQKGKHVSNPRYVRGTRLQHRLNKGTAAGHPGMPGIPCG
eukprot:1151195-Pelagomonas_calceolata.AAC.6